MGRKNEIEGQLNLWDMLTSAGSFPECKLCWCATCEHSTVGGSVPRPFGEVLRPCPSCELCINDGKADICIIGSAEEGCSYRAEKEKLQN